MMPEARQTLYKLGLASLSASHKDLEQLASAYWYTFEMGLCQDNGRSIVGGAVMSSKQETSNAMSASAKIIELSLTGNHYKSIQYSRLQPFYMVSPPLSELL